ncbi:hypothetical protein CANINC_001179 [Pichia inconspicua]|uniref:Major facilitator superfamily (MFS) profile domain-containing protein n=1 Tax=Pichia inconspicua TaxID=52247 RepID=A0A4T0X4H3_9ASCO|nr:hypothetical protein CANINC_001179 [[Candida] inconspicua]
MELDSKISDQKLSVTKFSIEELKPLDTESLTDKKPLYPEAERKLVHKFDWRLMPMFSTVYFFSSLDRSNIGNAKVAGMDVDLGLSAAQFSTVVSVLYATYLPFMVPGVWLMKQCKRPRFYLFGMMFSWSICSLCMMFAKNYGTVIVLRLLIGLFEGSYFSCIAVITSDYFFPHEMGRRTAYFFASSSLASAFGGLIGTGITEIKSGSLKSWQYIFLIEGLLSIFTGFWLLFFLPDTPEQLLSNEEERAVYADRERRRAFFTDQSAFERSEVWEAFKDYKTHFSVVIQFTQDVCLYGFSTFLPAILKSGLHYSSLQAQYLSVPVYLLGGLIFLIAAEYSDKKRTRGPVIAFCNVFGMTGYILLLVVSNDKVKYFACYLICFSIYTGTGINESWLASNTAGRYKRYTAIGINQTLGNVAGAISPQVYRKPPDYVLGHAFTLGCLVVSTIASLTCSWLLRRRNAANQKVMETGVDNRNKKRVRGDDSPEFRFLT